MCRNQLQYFRIAPLGIIETRGVNEDDPSAIQYKLIRHLDLLCTRSKAMSDFHTGPARFVHEL